MSILLAATGTWSIVTFTDNPTDLAQLADLRPQFSGMRFVAVVPVPMDAPADLAVLVDSGSRLATQLGVRGTRSFVLDGRGTVCHQWDGVPEHEAVAVFAARPPLPSGAPAWLFPVLATIVLLAGIGAWMGTHCPAPAVELASPPPVVQAAPPAPVEAAVEAAPAEAAPAAELTPAGRPRRGPPNLIGDWTVQPKGEAASVASDDGTTFSLSALAARGVSACRPPVPLTGPLKVSAEWNVSGVSGKAARMVFKQLDAAGKPLGGATGRAVVSRGKESGGWKAVSADVSPGAGATRGSLCIEMDAGAGNVQVRKPQP